MSSNGAPRAVVYGRQSRGKLKSIRDQIAECTADVAGQGWILAGTYQDGTSASRYARKVRDDWGRVLGEVDAGSFDFLVLWESSRGDRDAETWLGLLRRCRDHGVQIRVQSHGRTYNMSNPRDWKSLAEDGVASHYETDLLSIRVKRGVAASAVAGRPPMGFAPYGYRRVYDKRTGALARQESHPEHAKVVVEVFERVARAEPVSVIVRDLNARDIPAPKGGQWRRMALRDMCLNPAYVGQRKHQGHVYPAEWPAIVAPADYAAARRILEDPERVEKYGKGRPGRQVHLLTYLAECECGSPISARATYYLCRQKGCVSIGREKVDAFVREVMIERLSRPDIHSRLKRADETAGAELAAAEGEVTTLEEQLDKWRLSAALDETSPASLAVIERQLTGKIDALQARITAGSAPLELRAFVEPKADVRERWDSSQLAAKRSAIRTLLTVTIVPSPGGRNAYTPVHERVRIGWKTGV